MLQAVYLLWRFGQITLLMGALQVVWHFFSLRETRCNLTRLPRRIWQIQANSVIKNESLLLFNLFFSHIALASHSYEL